MNTKRNDGRGRGVVNSKATLSESMYSADNTFKPSMAKLFDMMVNIFKDYDSPPDQIFLTIGDTIEKDGNHTIKVNVDAYKILCVPHRNIKQE